MIIGIELMVHPGFTEDFKRQDLQWDDNALTMKDPRIFIGQENLTSRNMCNVAMHTEEKISHQRVC